MTSKAKAAKVAQVPPPSATPSHKEGSRAQRRKLKRQINSALGPLRNHENDYLKTLVDPEKHRNIRYPDEFLGATAMVGTLVVYDQYYFPDDSTLTPSAEAAGTLYTVVSPVMMHPVLEYRMENCASTVGLSASVLGQSDEFGIFPLVEDAPNPADTSNQMTVLANGGYQNIRAPFAYSDQDFALPPFRFSTPDGTVAYGIPFSDVKAAGVLTVLVSFRFAWVLPVGSNVSLRAIRPDGTVATASTGAFATASDGASVSLDVAPLLGTLANGQAAAPLPGIGFRVSVSLPATEQFRYVGVQSINLQVNRQQPRASSFWTNRFVPVNLPNASTYEATVDKYRLVSMSTWIEYEGSDLQNGGQLTSLYYGGGQSPMANGLYDYETISTVPNSYQGGLKLGSYTWWKPSDPADMLFRRLNGVGRWKYPFIVHYANVATPTQVNALRLKIAANYEIISTAQFYTYDYGANRPELIAHANSMLWDFPTSMENPLHWAAIKDVLTKAGKTAANVGKWALDNKSWLIPAVGAAASLL